MTNAMTNANTFLSLEEINSNPIYNPPAHWIAEYPADLLSDINNKNYKNCYGKINSLTYYKGNGNYFANEMYKVQERCGIEVLGKKAEWQYTNGYYVLNWITKKSDPINGYWITNKKSDPITIKELKKIMKENKVKGRSKASTITDCVELLMKI